MQLQVAKSELARITRQQRELNDSLHHHSLLLTLSVIITGISLFYAFYFYRRIRKQYHWNKSQLKRG
jgi:hypothetical protein